MENFYHAPDGTRMVEFIALDPSKLSGHEQNTLIMLGQACLDSKGEALQENRELLEAYTKGLRRQKGVKFARPEFNVPRKVFHV